MAIEVKIKKIGNLLGLIIPDEIVREKRLRSNDKVFIEINRPVDLRKFFGILKGKTRMTGQEFKDLARKGWNDNDESDNVKRKLDIQSFLGILPMSEKLLEEFHKSIKEGRKIKPEDRRRERHLRRLWNK